MAKKPTLTTVSSGYSSAATINADLQALRDGFDNTLSLDGSTPNAMEADFDVNGYDILNAGIVNAGSLRINGVAVEPTDSFTSDRTDVKYEFETVAELLAFSTVGYFTAGDYVKAGEYYYKKVTSGQDITIASGDKFNVVANIKSNGAFGSDTFFSDAIFSDKPSVVAIDTPMTSESLYLDAVAVIGQHQSITTTDSVPVNMLDNSKVSDLSIAITGTTATSEGIRISGDNIEIKDVSIDLSAITGAGSGRHGLVSNSGTRASLKIDGLKIIAPDGFAFLPNENGPVNKLMLTRFDLSGAADAIELNYPADPGTAHVIWGGFLDGGDGGSGSGSGFALGAAHVQGAVFGGYYSSYARTSGVHLEDGSKYQVHSSFVLRDNDLNGFWNQKGGYGNNEAENLPLVIGLFSMEGNSAAGSKGIYNVFDASGFADGDQYVGGYVNGFEAGISIVGGGIAPITSVTVQNATDTMEIGARSNHKGTIISYGADNLVNQTATSGGIIDRIVQTDAAPDYIVKNTGAIAGIRTSVKGFEVVATQSPASNTGSGSAEMHQLFRLASTTRMMGLLHVRLQVVGSASHSVIIAQVKWDGTTLTVTDSVKSESGTVFSSTPFDVSGGYLRARIASASAVSYTTICQFDGVYYE